MPRTLLVIEDEPLLAQEIERHTARIAGAWSWPALWRRPVAC
jgi:hypothetical protein